VSAVEEFSIGYLVGRTITAAEKVDHPGEWDEAESYVLTLDDGKRVEFSGWGYDAWGCIVDWARA
jgi:hypothetical protein